MKTKINPYLIPRFNIDYGVKDCIYALGHIKGKIDTSSIEQLFIGSYVNYTNSGRSCLYTILKALELPFNSCIGIPLYTCTSDFDAIIQAGHKPIFLDICPNTLTLDPEDFRRKSDKLDAIVVVHTFGIPADMDSILDISNGKVVIEDCAHSLLSKYKGNLTGTIGKAGFFSFRTGKYISAGEGGIIITKDNFLKEKIDKEIFEYLEYSLYNEITHSILTLARSFLYHRPWFGMFALPLGKMLENNIDIMNKYSFDIRKIRRTNLYTIQNKINYLENNVRMNVLNSKYLTEKIGNLKNVELPYKSEVNYHNEFLFPIVFTDEIIRDNVSSVLTNNNIDNIKMFSKTPEIAREKFGYKGDCPFTEKVTKGILVIPHYYTLNKKELDRIVDIIKKASVC